LCGAIVAPIVPGSRFEQEEVGKMPERNGSAEWCGDLKAGSGSLVVGDGVFAGAYSFASRFEEGPGTNPEELIAAAHAGCFAMALSAELGKANLVAESLKVTATVSLDKLDAGWTVTESHLELSGRVPGASRDDFDKAAAAAETGCPISRLLRAKITLDAKLES